jgi:hypothetical protein
VILVMAAFVAAVPVLVFTPRMMPGLADPGPVDNSSVPHTDDLVVRGAAEMAADRLPVIGDESDQRRV